MNYKRTSFESAARALGGHSRTPGSVLAPVTGSIGVAASGSPAANPGPALSVSGGLSGNPDVVQGIQQLASSLGQTTNSQQATVNGLLENTRALTDNTVAVGSQKSSALTTAGSIANGVLGGAGDGISPLLTGLFSLLGFGSQSQTLVPQIRYIAPPSVNLSGSVGSGSPSSGAATQSVNVQVTAMDSKSFLDHSEDIAQAVRQAILNSSNLNDVIADL